MSGDTDTLLRNGSERCANVIGRDGDNVSKWSKRKGRG